MSTLNGRRIHRAEVHIPRSGGWRADVVLDVGAVPAGTATLQIADLALVGKILPGLGGEDAPDLPHVVVAGGAGWDTRVPAGRYAPAVGAVRLSTVLRDLAAIAAEPYDAPAEVLLPPIYEWTASSPEAPRRARDVLADLVTRRAIPTWRMTPAGRTRFDAWPTLPEASGSCTVTSRDLAVGLRRCALTTRAAALLPGALLEGATVDRVVFTDEAGALTAEVWTEQAPTTPTLRRLVRALVLELFPWIARFGLVGQDLDVRSADGNIRLAGGGAPVHRAGDAGDAGTFTTPAPGSLTWTGPDGRIWALTFTSSPSGGPVTIAIISLDPDPGKITTKATTGSDRVSSG